MLSMLSHLHASKYPGVLLVLVMSLYSHGEWKMVNLQKICQFACLVICPLLCTLVLVDVRMGHCIAIGSSSLA